MDYAAGKMICYSLQKSMIESQIEIDYQIEIYSVCKGAYRFSNLKGFLLIILVSVMHLKGSFCFCV